MPEEETGFDKSEKKEKRTFPKKFPLKKGEVGGMPPLIEKLQKK